MKIMTRVVASEKTKAAEYAFFFHGVTVAEKDTKTHGSKCTWLDQLGFAYDLTAV